MGGIERRGWSVGVARIVQIMPVARSASGRRSRMVGLEGFGEKLVVRRSDALLV